MAWSPFLAGVLGALWRERRWDAESVRAYRTARLHALIRHARGSCALWRERLDHVDLDAEVNLAQIPPITKDELMAQFAGSVAGGVLSLAEVERHVRNPETIGRPLHGRLLVATTSGTTGRVGYFVKDVSDFAWMNGALMARVLRDRLIPRELLRFAFGRRYRMAMTIATEGHFITRLVSDFRPLFARPFLDLRAFSIMDPVEHLVCALNRFRPHYVHAYPTFLEALAHERLAGRLAMDPEFVSLGSEPFSLAARQTVARAFPRAQLSETYGATECLAIANQCSAGRLHVNEDLAILEPVDADGRPVPVGVPSQKVYVTNLVNRAQPVLRYELTDSVTLLGGDCPCGSPMASIRVEGRSDDTLFLQSGSGAWSAHPPVPFEALFLGVAGLRQYQLVHERQNHLLVRFVAEPEVDVELLGQRVGEAFQRYLERRQLDGVVKVRLESATGIERDERSHKVRQIYSKVARPAAV